VLAAKHVAMIVPDPAKESSAADRHDERGAEARPRRGRFFFRSRELLSHRRRVAVPISPSARDEERQYPDGDGSQSR
jgi:hypothetical protein